MRTAYQHYWSQSLRSSVMVGHTAAEPESWQAANSFESSTYGAVNLLWQVLPCLTLGAEYPYGQRENRDGSDLDSHRAAFGVQFY